jgi:hypothetical protein
MTKNKIVSVIKKYYELFNFALKIDANIEIRREYIKELQAITILAYFYLTGEDLQKETYKED